MTYCNKLKIIVLSLFAVIVTVIVLGLVTYENSYQQELSKSNVTHAVHAGETIFNVIFDDFNKNNDSNINVSFENTISLYNKIIAEVSVYKSLDVDDIWLAVNDPIDGLILIDGGNTDKPILKPSDYLGIHDYGITTIKYMYKEKPYLVAVKQSNFELLGRSVFVVAAKRRLTLSDISLNIVKRSMLLVVALFLVGALIICAVRKVFVDYSNGFNALLDKLENSDDIDIDCGNCFMQVEQLELVDKVKSIKSDITLLLEEAQIQRDKAEIALENICDGVIIANVDGSIVSVNKTGEEILGCKNDLVIGEQFSSVFKLITKKNRAFINSPIKMVMKTLSPVVLNSDTKLLLEGGRECLVGVNAAPLLDKNDEIYAVIVVFRDVTSETIKNESLENYNRLLKNNADDLKLILEVAKIAVWEYDTQNKVLQAGSDFYKLLHIEEKDCLSLQEDIFARVSNPEVLTDIVNRRVASRGKRFSVKLRFRGDDGVARWGLWIGEGKNTNPGEVVRYARGVVVDINENEEIQQELESQNRIITSNNKRLQQVYDLAKMFFWEYDPITDLLTGDSNFCEILLGLERKESCIPLSAIYERINPEYHKKIIGIIEKSKKDMLSGCIIEFSINTEKGGGEKYFRNYYNFEYSESGGELRSYGVVLDITEEREQQASAIQSSKMESIGMLSGGIAHDFNNMFSGVAGIVELLATRIGEGDPKSYEYCQHIKNACEHATELTQQLLSFSRKRKSHIELIDLNQIINNTIVILSHSVSKNISINFESKVENAICRGDYSEIQNSVLNLGINARDAICDLNDGVINISVEEYDVGDNVGVVCRGSLDRDTQYVQIRVEDNGKGIDSDIIKKIFEPFYTTKGEGKGTGLGLSVLGETIVAHDGVVCVHSVVGEGSVFTLLLPTINEDIVAEFVDVMPMNDLPENDLPENEVVAQNEATVKDRYVECMGCILIVDEDAVMRVAYKQMLNEYGYKVIEAENGHVGIQKYLENIELITGIIMDLQMAVLEGRMAFEEILKINKDVKLVFVSNFLGGVDRQDLLDMGALAVLSKPFRKKQFISSINKWFAAGLKLSRMK